MQKALVLPIEEMSVSLVFFIDVKNVFTFFILVTFLRFLTFFILSTFFIFVTFFYVFNVFNFYIYSLFQALGPCTAKLRWP